MIFDLSRLKYLMVFLLICAVVLCSALALADINTSAEQPEVLLPVIMYHHLSRVPSRLGKYTVSPEQLKSDLDYLVKNGYTTVSVAQLIDFCKDGKPLPKKPVMITFDDGYLSVFEYAVPLLRERKMHAVMNVIGIQADIYSKIEDKNLRYAHMCWKQLKALQDEGVAEIQNHTYNMHTNTRGRTGIQKLQSDSNEGYARLLSADLARFQQAAAENGITTPTAFAYPFGKISSQALPVIKSLGIKAVFCCWEKVNLLTGDPEQLYHINRFNRPHNTSTESFFKKIEQQMNS